MILPDSYADQLESLFGALVDDYTAMHGWDTAGNLLMVVARERVGEVDADTLTVLDLPDEVFVAAEGDFERVVGGVHTMSQEDIGCFHEMRRSCAATDGPVTAWALMTTFVTVGDDGEPLTLRLINAVDVDQRHYQAVRQKDGPLHATEWLTTPQLVERYRDHEGDTELPLVSAMLAEMTEASRVESANLAALDQLGAALCAADAAA